MSDFTLDHLHCWSANPIDAARVYVDFFAAEVLDRSETANGTRIAIRMAGQTIFIEQTAVDRVPPKRLGLEHLAIRTEDFDGVVARLRRRDAVFLVDPKQVGPGVRIAFVAVPDGGRVEIVERALATE